MNLDIPKMVFDPPLPRGVCQQMADDEKYETIKEISESTKKIAESAVADAQKSKKRANTATIISVLSLLVSFLTNVDKIAANIHFLINLLR